MGEELLPLEIRQKAILSGKEYGWRKDDFAEVVEVARKIGLVSLGGQPQFLYPSGTVELYWIEYDSEDRKPGEAWQDYVNRSAEEVLRAFQKMCSETDFNKSVEHSKFVQENVDPLEYLWFIGYFVTEDELKQLKSKFKKP